MTYFRLPPLLLCLGLLLGWLPAFASEPALTPIQVAPRTWYFQGDSGMASTANRGFMSNAGFTVTDSDVVVFDSLGTPALGEAMIAAIRKLSGKPIRLVIVSHYHADHFYGLQAFKAVGAEIWAHQAYAQYFKSDVAQQRLAQRRQDLFPWVDEQTRLTAPDRTLRGAVDFQRGGRAFRLIDAGGAHAPDDYMLYLPDEGVLFAGDLFFAGRLPFVGDADTKQWLAALDAMLAVKPKVVVPGHGAVSRQAEADIRLTRDYLIFLRQQMGAAVADMTSFDEAYARTDWSAYEKLPAFSSANRQNAYNVYLQMERESLGK